MTRFRFRCSVPAIDRLLADLYSELHSKPSDRIVLDLDVTDIPGFSIDGSGLISMNQNFRERFILAAFSTHPLFAD